MQQRRPSSGNSNSSSSSAGAAAAVAESRPLEHQGYNAYGSGIDRNLPDGALWFLCESGKWKIQFFPSIFYSVFSKYTPLLSGF